MLWILPGGVGECLGREEGARPMSCKNRSDSKGKTAPRRERRSPGRGAAGKGREGAFPPPGRAPAAGEGRPGSPPGSSGKAGKAPGSPDHSRASKKSRRGTVARAQPRPARGPLPTLLKPGSRSPDPPRTSFSQPQSSSSGQSSLPVAPSILPFHPHSPPPSARDPLACRERAVHTRLAKHAH